MAAVIWTAAVYFAALLNLALSPRLALGPAGPDFLLLVALGWLWHRPPRLSLPMMAALGLLADLLGPGRIGIDAGGYLLLGYGITRLRETRWIEGLPARALVAGVAAGLLALGSALVRRFLGEHGLEGPELLEHAAAAALATGIAALPVLAMLGAVARGSLWGRHASETCV